MGEPIIHLRSARTIDKSKYRTNICPMGLLEIEFPAEDTAVGIAKANILSAAIAFSLIPVLIALGDFVDAVRYASFCFPAAAFITIGYQKRLSLWNPVSKDYELKKRIRSMPPVATVPRLMFGIRCLRIFLWVVVIFGLLGSFLPLFGDYPLDRESFALIIFVPLAIIYCGMIICLLERTRLFDEQSSKN